MYESFFGLKESPFSIAPNPRYLYMSEQHQEALAHLLYGVRQEGGFIVLTGEVGTGKTTVCRCFLEQLPKDVDVAFILNSKLTRQELLETFCDELDIPCPEGASSSKPYIDAILAYLLEAHSLGRKTLLLIDEAQNLAPDVLEQVRLLTNLETNNRKLLQIVLVGQPELQQVFSMPEMRQLAQRVTARYHLNHLRPIDVWRYICHRLDVAGCRQQIIPASLVKPIMHHTRGIPRLINVLCDRMLLGAYVQKKHVVNATIVKSAAREVFGQTGRLSTLGAPTFQLRVKLGIAAALFLAAGLSYWLTGRLDQSSDLPTLAHDSQASFQADANPEGRALQAAGQTAAQTSVDSPAVPNPAVSSPSVSSPAVSSPAVPNATLSNSAPSKRVPPLDPSLASPGGARSATDSASGQGLNQQYDRVGGVLAGAEPVSADRAGESRLSAEASPPAGEQPVYLANRNTQPAASRLAPALGPLLWPTDVPIAQSEQRAAGDLLAAWRQSLPVYEGESACEVAQRAGLACSARRAESMGELRLINRPVILQLTESQTGPFYATLERFEADMVYVRIAGKVTKISARLLVQQWAGDYIVFWLPPENYYGPIVPGTIGTEVREFSQRLGLALGSRVLAQGVTDYTIKLETAVRDFQRQQGLEVDGIVGMQTLIALNSILNSDVVPLLVSQ